MALTHLDRLEAESIHILRETVAEAARPVMLYSIGKDSAVMLHLAKKAFFPAPLPFPLLHVDTRWKFRDMYALRDKVAGEHELLVHENPEAVARGHQSVRPWPAAYRFVEDAKGCGRRSTRAASTRRSGARGATRRRAAPRNGSSRSASAQHRWDPKRQRPELWSLYNVRKSPGESMRVFPLSNWTELDIWQYIMAEGIEIVPLYLAAPRPTVERDGLILMVDDERFRLEEGEQVGRAVGAVPDAGLLSACRGRSRARPTRSRRSSRKCCSRRPRERQGRVIDRDGGDGSMEKKKQEGYF